MGYARVDRRRGHLRSPDYLSAKGKLTHPSCRQLFRMTRLLCTEADEQRWFSSVCYARPDVGYRFLIS